jgi:hypothetical protein
VLKRRDVEHDKHYVHRDKAAEERKRRNLLFVDHIHYFSEHDYPDHRRIVTRVQYGRKHGHLEDHTDDVGGRDFIVSP